MPANRSRTERWREALQQIHQRGGSLEIALPRSAQPPSGDGADLIWRVHLLGLTDQDILVEPPTAMGERIVLQAGVELIGAMSIGQNRWMFHTRVVGSASLDGGRGALRLAMPEGVERCQRRSFYRISTAELCPPPVECWPLLDPTTVVAAEVANRAQILAHYREGSASGTRRVVSTGTDAADPCEPIVLPEVGPRFTAMLVNIGGGGAGLLIRRSEAAAIDRGRLFWMRIDLTPFVPCPIGLTGKLAHSHIDSEQNVYAGIAFDFTFNLAHKQFIVEQICRYVTQVLLQRERAAQRQSA